MKDFKVDMSIKTPYDEMIAAAEAKHGLPHDSLRTIMLIENRNVPKADRVSPAGAKGLMQVMPFNMPEGKDPFNPKDSIDAGAQVLSNFYQQYGNDPVKAIAAYNGGNRQAHRLEAGKPMTKETADYVGWATEALQLDNPAVAAKPNPRMQEKAANAAAIMGNTQPSLGNPADNQPQDSNSDYLAQLEQQGAGHLAKDAELTRVGFFESVGEGFKQNVTGAMLSNFESNLDAQYGYSFGEAQSEKVKGAFTGGLDTASGNYLRLATSDADLDSRIAEVKNGQAYSSRWNISTGFSSVPGYLGNFAGMAADPVLMAAIPAGPFASAARGSGIVASTAAHAADGAILGGASAAVVENSRYGEVEPEHIAQAMAVGAVLGGGFGLAGKALRRSGMSEEAAHFDQAEAEATLDHTRAQPRDYAAADPSDGLVVDFDNVLQETVVGPDGAQVSGTVDHVLQQADNWDESFTGVAESVHNRRAAYYNSPVRNKLFGWLDSEGLRLAKSDNKVARWLGAHLSGDQSGLGKQFSRNAAVTKEQLRAELSFKHIPQIKDAFLASLHPTEYADFMAGGGTAARARFSREVQLERTARRKYLSENGSLDGYNTSAPEHIQRGATALDNFHAEVRDLRVSAKTEGWEALRDSEPVGYIEQSPDYIAIQRASPNKRRALFDMVREDYVRAGRDRIESLKADREARIDALYDFYNQHPKAPGINEFLTDPEAFYLNKLDKLGKKISLEMERRAGHWWENALANPEERYANSEASLMQLVREMSQEHFEDRLVDKKVLDDFRRGLTQKWADKRRREFDMGKYRDVDGERVYMLDMFKHDAMTTTVSNINQTAGQSALAKLGWRSEQDIANTMQALRAAGVADREVQAAKSIFDEILGRFKGVDDQPTVRMVNNLLYSAQMGKLPIAQLADIPAAIANLGTSGMVEALGPMARNIMSGKSLTIEGKLTHVGRDLNTYLTGLEGRDHELWTGVEVSADGNAMDTASGLLSRSAAGPRMTNALSGANIVSRTLNGGYVVQTAKLMHRFFKGSERIHEARLADVGLHPEVVERIKEQVRKYGTDEEFGLDRWDDPLAKEDLINATYKYAYQTNMDTSLAGDNPKWVRDNLLGVLFSKFRIIGSRAQERMLVRNITIGDTNTVQALVVGASISTLFAYGRIHIDSALKGDTPEELKKKLSPINVANTSMMYMSMLGLGSEVTNFLNIATGGGAHASNDTALTGYVTKATDAAGKLSGVATGAATAGDAGKALFKLLPGSNTYGALAVMKALSDD